MKHLKSKYFLQILAFILFSAGITMAQKPAKPAKTATVVIHTSATCDECKTIIEAALKGVKGVKKSNLDVDTKDVTVVYSPKKTDESTIRKAISKAGYDADDLPKDQEAHDNLPACCRKVEH
jgi:periplasmic mercuric ion binding protein